MANDIDDLIGKFEEQNQDLFFGGDPITDLVGPSVKSAPFGNIGSQTSGLTSAAGAIGAVGQAGSSIISGVFGGIVGGIQADTARIRAKAAEEARKFNAQQANLAAERVLDRAKEQESDIMERAGQMAGQQTAAFAGQGVKVGTGVASQVVAQTRRLAAEDVDALRSNAAHQALGLKAQAFNQQVAGMVEAGNLRTQATNSLISGGASMARGLVNALDTLRTF